MKPEVPISDSNHCTTGFHHFVGGYRIDMPCVNTLHKTLFVHNLYSLIDFNDNGSILERAVRFFDAYLRGYDVTIVVVDLDTGEIIKRKHRINTNILPCNWMLIEIDFLNPTRQKGELHNTCD